VSAAAASSFCRRRRRGARAVGAPPLKAAHLAQLDERADRVVAAPGRLVEIGELGLHLGVVGRELAARVRAVIASSARSTSAHAKPRR